MTEPVPTSRGRSAGRAPGRAPLGAIAGAIAGAVAGAIAGLGAGAAALVLVSSSVAEAAPAGRVVRVERTPLGAVPRLCVLGMGSSAGTSMCLGQPRPGERVVLIDVEDRTISGELVIDSVSEDTELGSIGLCVSSGVRSVTGSITAVHRGRTLVGLRGGRLNPRQARVLAGVSPPSGRADEAVELAVDADGNGRPDLIVTQYTCDAGGAPSSGTPTRCIDTYMEQSGGMRRVLQETIGPCR